ncbi:MAG: DUF3592 domain-containing protein [Fimbriimonas sp.]
MKIPATGPRAVRLRDNFGWGLRAFEVGIAALLLGGHLAIDHLTADARELQARGVHTQGKITNRQSLRSGKLSSGSIAFEYVVAGKTYEGSRDVSFARGQTTKAGDAISVYYLPDRPAVHEVDILNRGEAEARRSFYLWTLFGTGGALSLIAIALRTIARRQRAILREWPAVPVQVLRQVGLYEVDVQVGESEIRRVRTRFHSPGELPEGTTLLTLRNPAREDELRLVSDLTCVEPVGESTPIL